MKPEELNRQIAELVYPNDSVHQYFNTDEVYAFNKDTGRRTHNRNYCNNWNDLMPLVWENRIAFEAAFFKDREGDRFYLAHTTFKSDGDVSVLNTNPQMALAQCLLKVLEAKEKNDG